MGEDEGMTPEVVVMSNSTVVNMTLVVVVVMSIRMVEGKILVVVEMSNSMVVVGSCRLSLIHI